MRKKKKLKEEEFPSRKMQKTIAEGFLIVISDPVQGLDSSSGQLHDVFQKIMDELNTDEEKKKFFMRMNGYFFEIAELYYV